MSYKNLIVHLDSSDRAMARLDAAIALAKRWDSRVVGVFAEVDSGLLGRTAEAEVVVAYDIAGKEFEARTAAAGVPSVWRSLVHGNHHQVTQTVIEAARRADLTILGQTDREDRGSRTPADLAEQVVINSGRPVLLLPYAGSFPNIGNRVLVAWNGGRESARAANDAIPLIRNAERVVVMAMNPQGARPLDGSGLCDHLACHGINADRELLEVKDISVADYVLSHCTDIAADLLVMGAFGHYGFPHMLRGGVTRDIIAHLTVPVLLSH